MKPDEDEQLLCALKFARQQSGLPLDFWADFLDGVPYSLAAILCGRSPMFPKYMKSRGKP